MRPFIIGIVGPSCCGKTSLCEKINEKIEDCLTIHLDNYWKDKSSFQRKYGFRNWELPNNLKFDLLNKNLRELKAGRNTEAPYCGDDGRFIGYKTLMPSDTIITEGFLLFYYRRIRETFNLKIYVDISDEEVIRRRILRNRSKKKGRELYYREVVVKEYKKYGEPVKKYADLIIDGKEDINKNIMSILKEIKGLNS